MADISYFQNAELEDSSDGMEDEYGKADDQQGLGDGGDAGGRDGGPELTPLDRLFQHAVSHKPGERQMVGKLLINIFQNAVKSKLCVNLDEVFQPVEHIIYDTESAVRSSLVECLPHVAIICQEVPYLFGENLTSRILNIILIYIRDQDNQVRQDAQTALRMLLERDLLDDEQIQQDVCSVIVELSREECPEFQTLALTLMTKVNPYIGNALTEKLFLDRFLELCSNEGFFVRRVCASIMGEFCTIMSKETIYNKLLQTYANLCLDNIWGVRKTSVDVMMSVARCVPLSMRRLLLSKLLVRHLRDESRWVRRSAYEILGPFISTFAKQFHELICDQKGELVLVYENERGWPRFNVVPVAKVSDILTENLANRLCLTEDFYWKPNLFQQDLKRRRRAKEQKLDELAMGIKHLYDRKNANQTDEYKNFNLFQYYYDPPDMPLDPELVESIINDNELSEKLPKYKVDENQAVISTKLEQFINNYQFRNEIDNNEKNDQQDNNENTENKSEPQHQGENENKNEEQLYQQDSNDNNEHEVRLQSKNENEREICEEDSKEEEDNDEEEAKKWVNRDGQDKRVMRLNAQKRYARRKQTQVTSNVANCSFNFMNDLEPLETSDTSLDQGSSSSTSHFQLSSLSSLSNFNNGEDDEDADEIVPRILVDHFVSMADLQSPSNDVGPDIDYHCAFSFPAVVLTLGKDNWHRLKDAYQRLAGAVAWKVRSTLASSIHEIAIIIEKDYAARDLVPIYNGFIKDLDEVRIGALKHFSTFLKVLSPQDRMQYLPKLNDFLITDSKWNWRLREELVKQLSEIIHLYQRIDVAQYIAPLLLHLMQDRVAAVRQEALDAISRTIAYLACHSDDALAIAMIQEMRDLLMKHAAEGWTIRQTYALVCSKLVENSVISGEVFARELLPYLLELSYDKVPNVRLVVARTLARDVLRINDFLEPELMNEVQQKLKVMQSDCDRDVRIFASEVESDKFY